MDVKLKCDKCGRTIFLSPDETAKMTVSYSDGETKND